LFLQVVPFEAAMTLSFFLMHFDAFDNVGKPIDPQVSKFIAVNFFALLQTILISMIFTCWALPATVIEDNPEVLAHLLGALTPVVMSYFGHKFLALR